MIQVGFFWGYDSLITPLTRKKRPIALVYLTLTIKKRPIKRYSHTQGSVFWGGYDYRPWFEVDCETVDFTRVVGEGGTCSWKTAHPKQFFLR